MKAMTREERLEHIWSSTHDDYRGYAGEMVRLLDELTDAEVSAKLPVHLRYLPDALAA